MADLHDLAAAYALDGLDDDERASFSQHLAGCSQCRADVVMFRETASSLAAGTAVAPPQRLKATVMDAIDRGGTASVVRGPWYRQVSVTRYAVAAALVLLVAVSTFLFTGGSTSTIDEVLAADDTMIVALDGDDIDAKFTFSLSRGMGVFESTTLPATGPESVYQLWLIEGDQPSSAGVFSPRGNGTSVALVENVRDGLVLGLTVEPAGGSPLPTGDVLLATVIG